MGRFHNFDDALVRGLQLVLSRASGRAEAVITLEAREAREDVIEWEDAWFQVLLRVDPVTEYRFVEGERVSHYVLSSGLKIKEFEGIHFFEFGGEIDEPETLDEFRNSPFSVAGRDYSWEVRPYPKS